MTVEITKKIIIENEPTKRRAIVLLEGGGDDKTYAVVAETGGTPYTTLDQAMIKARKIQEATGCPIVGINRDFLEDVLSLRRAFGD